MKKRRIKIRPLPPELASAAKRKALFASLLGEGGTPYPFSQNNAYPARKPNAAKDLGGKTGDGQSRVGVAAALPTRQQKGPAGGQSRVGVAAALPARQQKGPAGGQSRVGVAAALPTRQQKCGAPKGNRNALRHGGFTAKRLAARAQVRRIVADVDLAIALAFCASKGES